MIKISKFKEKGFVWLYRGIACFFLLKPNIASLVFILVTLTGGLIAVKKEISFTFSRHEKTYLLLCLFLYLSRFIGINDFNDNGLSISIKYLGFVLIPLSVILLNKISPISRVVIFKLSLWIILIAGIASVLAYLILAASWVHTDLYETLNKGLEDQQNFRILRNILQIVFSSHSTYFSLIVVWAVLNLSFYLFRYKATKLKSNFARCSIIFGLIALTMVFFIASRSAIILFFIGFVCILSTNGSLKIRLIRVGVFLLIFITTSMAIPSVKTRFSHLTTDSWGKDVAFNKNSISMRYANWDCAKDIFLANPVYGVGIDEGKKSLKQCYLDRYNSVYLGKFNSHNQYLDILINNGIIGLVIFLLVMLFLIYVSIKRKTIELGAIVLFLSLALLTENLLSRAHGIMFFGLFVTIYYLLAYNSQYEFEERRE